MAISHSFLPSLGNKSTYTVFLAEVLRTNQRQADEDAFIYWNERRGWWLLHPAFLYTASSMKAKIEVWRAVTRDILTTPQLPLADQSVWQRGRQNHAPTRRRETRQQRRGKDWIKWQWNNNIRTSQQRHQEDDLSGWLPTTTLFGILFIVTFYWGFANLPQGGEESGSG